jgi:hypothetical protein
LTTLFRHRVIMLDTCCPGNASLGIIDFLDLLQIDFLGARS